MEEQGATKNSIALAWMYLEMDRPEQALEVLQSPESEQIEDPWFWLLRGQAYCSLDQVYEAIGATRKGLALAPEHPFLLWLLAICQEKRGDLAAAETAILGALRQQSENSAFLCRYARLLVQGEQMAKAERVLERAQQRDPDDPEVRYTASLLAYLRGDDRRALRASVETLRDNPDDVYSRYTLGHVLMEQGRVQGAARHLRTAARLEPGEVAFTRAARASRTYAHWLLWPLRPFYRIGTARLWIGAIGIYLILRMLGLDTVARYFSIAYLALCVYSWVVPPAVKWWYRHKYRVRA